MRNLKILLFDLDGTLLRDDKTLSEYTLEILSKKECGYLIGISTSRSEQNCLGFLREMKPNIFSSGGAVVRVNEKIICSSAFLVIATKGFIESVRKICGMDCEITVDTLDAHYWNYKTNPKEQDKSWGDSTYTDFKDFKCEALKICVEIPNLAQVFEMDNKDYVPNGSVFSRPSARAVIIKDGKIAMVYSKKYNYYKFPGGGIEADECMEDALIREVLEETGLCVIRDSIQEYGQVHRMIISRQRIRSGT